MIATIRSIFDRITVPLNRLNRSDDRWYVFGLAILVFTTMVIYTLGRSSLPFVHDSAHYWDLSDSFSMDGRFSLLSYANELRGYAFPLLLYLLKEIATLLQVDAKILFYISSSLFFSSLCIYILPWFAHTLFGWKTNLIGRASIALLVFVFWRGHFLYPLSDFPALAALLTGTATFVLAIRCPSKTFLALLAGCSLSLSTNIRPIYLISLILLFLSALVFLRKEDWRTISKWLGIFLLGCFMILFPQYLINRVHFQVNSPLVQAHYGSEESLYIKQLFWGLETQKFETNLGSNFPSIVVLYSDPFKANLQGTTLLKDKTLAGYSEIARRYPLELAVSYFRHTFNGLDVYYPTPYVKNVHARRTLFHAINYLIWFLVVHHLLRSDFPDPGKSGAVVMLGLISPVVLTIPTVIEVRFFLPAHLLAYSVIAFGFNLKVLAKSFLENKWSLMRFIIVCILWVVLCFTLSATTLENMGY